MILAHLRPKANEILHSIVESSYNSGLMQSVHAVHVIRKAHIVHYNAPQHYPYWFRREFAFPTRHIYRLKSPEVLVADGGVFLNGLWLQESFGHYRSAQYIVARWRVLRWRRDCWRKRVEISGSCTCLVVTGYYHFLLESLVCLLHTLSCYPGICVFTAKCSGFSFVGQYLDLLKQTGAVKQIEYIEPLQVHCKDYLFTALEEKSGFVCPVDVDILRTTFLPLVGDATAGRTRIFITRRGNRRSFCNQETVEKFLEQHGFEVICLEEQPVLEQIKLFRDAEVIVANHGAGLANIVWCVSCRLVVELFSPCFFNDCYFRLARTCGITYDYLIADGVSGWGSINLNELKDKV